ncbi:hypothetical protein FOZ63_023468, partial [Perkinsus olseni]
MEFKCPAFPCSGKIAMLAASVNWQWRSFATKRSAKPRQRVFDMKVSKNAPTKTSLYDIAAAGAASSFVVMKKKRRTWNVVEQTGVTLVVLGAGVEAVAACIGADSIPLVSTVSSAVVETTREGTPEPSAIKWHYQERSYSTTSPFMPGRVSNLRSAAIRQSLATQ